MLPDLPADFADRMRARLGSTYEAFLAALAQPAPNSLRLHPRKSAPLPFGLGPAVPWHPLGRYLAERPRYILDPALHAGAYYVQEASSMAIHQALAQHAAPRPGLRVLDLCAAPGGKSTLLAAWLDGQGLLLANEAIRGRIPPLRENLTRWGYPNVLVSQHDPEDFAPLAGFFDVVLVDAPCSGEGLFRKDAEAIGEWGPGAVALCEARQRRILEAALPLLAPAGLLIYSTCTYNPGENAAQVQWLAEAGGLEHLPLDLPAAWGIEAEGLGYQFYPHRLQGEGFYMACLRQKTAAGQPAGRPAPALKRWKALPAKDTAPLRPWLDAALAAPLFFQNEKGALMALPEALLPDAARLAAHLPRLFVGTPLGELKKQDLIPAHELALSLWRAADVPALDVDGEAALAFLRKQVFPLPATEVRRGWVLLRHGGLGLGWAKLLPGRWNNYLPMEWRIRTQH